MPALNKSLIFGTFLWSKRPEKIWLFPNIYDNALGAWNSEKRGFYSIFVGSGTKIFEWFFFQISDVKPELS